jgi:hypothetical protein
MAAALAVAAPTGLITAPNAVSATASFLTLPTHWLVTHQWWAPLHTILSKLSRLPGCTWCLSTSRRSAFAEHVPVSSSQGPASGPFVSQCTDGNDRSHSRQVTVLGPNQFEHHGLGQSLDVSSSPGAEHPVLSQRRVLVIIGAVLARRPGRQRRGHAAPRTGQVTSLTQA